MTLFDEDLPQCPHCNGTGRMAPKRTTFRKPTLAELTAYCLERRNGIDPQAFLDHYDSNGWRVGKTAMKDWKAAVRTWERNRQHGNKQQFSGIKEFLDERH